MTALENRQSVVDKLYAPPVAYDASWRAPVCDSHAGTLALFAREMKLNSSCAEVITQ